MSDLDRHSITKNLRVTVNTKKLIELVNERPCLWDRAMLEYRNRVFKERAWQEICCYFKPDYESLSPREKYHIGVFLSKKWCNLRDSYVKSKKPIRVVKRPYVYSEEMKFLDSTLLIDPVTGKKRERGEDEERMSNEEEENESEEQGNWIDEVYLESDNMDQSDVPSKRVKLEYDYPKEINNSETIHTSFLEHLIQREDDEDHAFFKSITPAVKTLSENSKLEFKILVMKLLKNLKMRDRQKAEEKKDKPSQVESESE